MKMKSARVFYRVGRQGALPRYLSEIPDRTRPRTRRGGRLTQFSSSNISQALQTPPPRMWDWRKVNKGQISISWINQGTTTRRVRSY
jgi:hypothetical protein